MPTPTWIPPLLALAAMASAAPALGAGLSNEEFAARVRTLRAQMAGDDAVVREALTFCPFLPRHRAMEEPRCVALRGHLRANAGRLRSTFPSADAPALPFQAGTGGGLLG